MNAHGGQTNHASEHDRCSQKEQPSRNAVSRSLEASLPAKYNVQFWAGGNCHGSGRFARRSLPGLLCLMAADDRLRVLYRRPTRTCATDKTGFPCEKAERPKWKRPPITPHSAIPPSRGLDPIAAVPNSAPWGIAVPSLLLTRAARITIIAVAAAAAGRGGMPPRPPTPPPPARARILEGEVGCVYQRDAPHRQT